MEAVDFSRCQYCSSTQIIYDARSSLYVCARCGSVLGREIFDGLETRPFDQTLPRTSGSYTNRVHDRGVGSTEIDVSYRDGHKWLEMNKLQKGIRVSREDRIVEKSLRILNHYSKVLEVPSYVEETSAYILREAVKGKKYKTKTLRNLALASIYKAHKVHGIPIPAKLFMKKAGVQPSSFWKALREIQATMTKLNIRAKEEAPESLTRFIVNRLGLTHRVEVLANELIDCSKRAGLDLGKPCAGLAAAAVYLASILLNERRTQLQVAETVNISDVGIRNRYSDMISSLEILVYM